MKFYVSKLVNNKAKLFCDPGNGYLLSKIATQLRITSLHFKNHQGFCFYELTVGQYLDAIELGAIAINESEMKDIIHQWLNPPERDYSPLVFIDGDYQKIDQHIEKNYQFTEKQLKEAEHRQKHPTIVPNARSKG